MSVDIVARGLAIAATRNAGGGVAPLAFADLPTATIPAAVGSLAVTVGSHPAVVVADGLADAALAAAHPRCCKADAAGRHFRLVADAAGAISVEQCGATGAAGTNDRPAFQAAIDYAHAVGIARVVMTRPRYELWTAPRVTAATMFADDGHCLVIRGGISLEGVGCTPLLLRKNAAGATFTAKQAYTVAGTTYYWRGGALFFSHAPGAFAADSRTRLRNFVIDGGLDKTSDFAPRATTDNADDGWDVTDKGLWIQDHVVGLVELEDVEIRRFRGELLYGLLNGNKVVVRRCHVHTTNASCDNLFQGEAEYHDCRFGNARFGAEQDGSKTYVRCTFYDVAASSFGGGGNTALQYNFLYPVRDPDLPPPWTTFVDTEFVSAGHVGVGAWTRGAIRLTNTSLRTQFPSQNVADIDLVVDAVIDGPGGSDASLVFLTGPATLTDPIGGAPAGTYNQPIERVSIHVRSALRTRQARASGANGFRFQQIFCVEGFLDPETVVLSAGDAVEADFFWRGPIPAGGAMAALPRVPRLVKPGYDWGWRGENAGTGGYDTLLFLDGDATIADGWIDYLLRNVAAGAITAGMGTSKAYAHGQRIRLTIGEFNTQPIVFPKNGAGLRLSADRALIRPGEWLELEWRNAVTGYAAGWIEAGWFGQGA